MSGITGLRIENFKKIVCFDMNPDGSVITIAGKNGQGKSSILDAIMVALCGRVAMPDKPVRAGEPSAEIVLQVDGFTVTRKIKPDGSGSVTITTADGSTRPQPQAWLDAKIGKLTFDPSAFLRLKPVEQAEMLRKLTGVDVADLDAEKSAVYQERLLVGRDRDAAQGAAQVMPFHADAPAAEVSMADLVAEQQEAAAAQSRKRELAAKADAEREAAKQKRARIVEIDHDLAQVDEATRLEIADLEQRIAAAKARAIAKTADLETRKRNNLIFIPGHEKAESDAQSAADAIMTADPSEMQARIGSIETVNRKVRENAARKVAQERAELLAATYKDKSERLDAIAADKAKRIAAAKMPVAGLGFSDDGAVTFRDMPLTQASQAEAIRVSMAIGLALNPELKIVLIRDGSLLDTDSRALVAELADNAGAQVWIEVVGTDSGGVVIEDGKIKATGAAKETNAN